MKANRTNLYEFDQPVEGDAWYALNDTVMGGHSYCRFQVLPGSVGVFSGHISLEDGGGFAAVRTVPARIDLSWAAGLKLCVCGDGKTYKLRLRTDPGWDGVNYEVSFATQAQDWQTEVFGFERFRPVLRGQKVWNAPELDPAAIYSFGLLISDRQEGPFRLVVDWLRAYE
jgi:NADH dehydrogenase [ubiquinone] 1 alpha subcomplex assembly factor 1